MGIATAAHLAPEISGRTHLVPLDFGAFGEAVGSPWCEGLSELIDI